MACQGCFNDDRLEVFKWLCSFASLDEAESEDPIYVLKLVVNNCVLAYLRESKRHNNVASVYLYDSQHGDMKIGSFYSMFT